MNDISLRTIITEEINRRNLNGENIDNAVVDKAIECIVNNEVFMEEIDIMVSEAIAKCK
jgi:hypothetical protein